MVAGDKSPPPDSLGAARVGERREGVGTREDTGERNRCEPRTGGEAAGEMESERRVGKTDWGIGNAVGR